MFVCDILNRLGYVIVLLAIEGMNCMLKVLNNHTHKLTRKNCCLKILQQTIKYKNMFHIRKKNHFFMNVIKTPLFFTYHKKRINDT